MLLHLVNLVAIVASDAAEYDWLVTAGQTPSAVTERCWAEYGDGVCGIEIGNGLVSRRFVTAPAFGTIDWLRNTTTEFGGFACPRFCRVHDNAARGEPHRSGVDVSRYRARGQAVRGRSRVFSGRPRRQSRLVSSVRRCSLPLPHRTLHAHASSAAGTATAPALAIGSG